MTDTMTRTQLFAGAALVALATTAALSLIHI